jgi:hypothetical protein
MKGQVMNVPTTNQSSLSGRRREAAWLALIPALGLLCLAVIPPALSGEVAVGSGEVRVEGSWLATVALPDGTAFESLMSFCDGGAMIASDPSVFPRMATAYHGTWTKTGRREFVLTMVGFIYDNVEDQYPNGMTKIIIKETDTIEPDGDTYNGNGTVEIHGLDGTLLATFPTPTHATRIKAE